MLGGQIRNKLFLVAGLSVLLWAFAGCSTSSSYWARFLLWRNSDIGDIERFPTMEIPAPDKAFQFRERTKENPFLPVYDAVRFGEEQMSLQELLERTGSTAFFVIRDDELWVERYFNGYGRESVITSFSVAKSVLSALVGVAIADGHVGSVEDSLTAYLPELAQRDPRLAQIRLRHLLTMSSGLAFRPMRGKIPLRADPPRIYYTPDLRTLALGARVAEAPGQSFVYNSLNAVLIGMVLEEATGRPVAKYLGEKIWQPLGMEAAGSWSLDSRRHGLAKMESGINARAIDFLKLGRLYLRRGDWDGTRVLPEAWAVESTRRDTKSDPSEVYQYFWWLSTDGEGNDHPLAEGNLGQFLFIAPEADLVIARFGYSYGLNSESWKRVFERLLADYLAQSDAKT